MYGQIMKQKCKKIKWNKSMGKKRERRTQQWPSNKEKITNIKNNKGKNKKIKKSKSKKRSGA
jgi:hypothetical protein